MNEINKLIKKSNNPKLIGEAFEFAKEAYKNKIRLSGENYIEHAIRVADFLQKMGLDQTTVAAAILHDILDEAPQGAKKFEASHLEKRFGKEIANLVEKVSNLSRIRYSLAFNIREKKAFTAGKLENLRKMFLAMAGDLRVVLIELASRLDGLNYLGFLPEDQQKLSAVEALQVYVPIANRLGLGEIKRIMEDLAFYYLFSERYKWLQTNIKEAYEERKKYLESFIPWLKKIFKKERVKFSDINYRAKSYWSTYQKLSRHNMDFDKIHDLMALRIIVPDIETCYKALGVLHKYTKPFSEEINDYIAKPKQNGYRSLHTTIFPERLPAGRQGKITEIQIRTEEMHREAEYGVCAHWSYKENINLKKEGRKFEWVSKLDFFEKQVFSLTPGGDIVVLKKGSTPVDFAYAVHSDIGNHAESAKIGGKIVPLSHIIENGDVVEITTNKKKKPSQDWLKFVKTSLAQSHIKKALAQNQPVFKFPLPNFIKQKFAEISEMAGQKKKEKQEKQELKKHVAHIYLAGQKGMLVNIAKCCNPQPGDKVQAYLTKYRAAVLHKISCENFKKLTEKFPDKIISATWQ